MKLIKRNIALLLSIILACLSFSSTAHAECVAPLTPEELNPDYVDNLGYVTHGTTVLEGQYIKYIIDDGIYVRDDEVELTDQLCQVIETVTGLKYKNKVNIFVKKNTGAKTYSNSDVYIMGCQLIGTDALCGSLNSTAHELAHALYFQNAGQTDISDILTEGYASYTVYKVNQYILTNSSILSVFENMKSFYNNNRFSLSYTFEHELSYWLDNGFNSGLNPNYNLGSALMWYLDDVFGNYSLWIGNISCDNNSNQYLSLTNIYSVTLSTDFYTWLSDYTTNPDKYVDADLVSEYERINDLCNLLKSHDMLRNVASQCSPDKNIYMVRIAGDITSDKAQADVVLLNCIFKEAYPNTNYKYGYDNYVFYFLNGYEYSDLLDAYRFSDVPIGCLRAPALKQDYL